MLKWPTYIRRWIQEHEADIEEMKYSLTLIKQNPLSIIGFTLFLFFIFMAITAPFISPYDPLEISMPNRLQPPSIDHLLGTDDLGRDILSRIIWGSRISLGIGVIVTLISTSIGTFIGIVSGYIGGRFDEFVMRLTDLFLAFPSLILAMAISAALGKSLMNTMIAIAITRWPVTARLARGQALSVKEEIYVEAARSIGARKRRIMIKHILPNSLGPIIVAASLGMGGIIMTAASLGFLGLGAQPPTPEWGVMISDGRGYIMNKWWLSGFPGIFIFITVLSLNIFGDSLRDILDPRTRRGGV